jgi:hypothetical protein
MTTQLDDHSRELSRISMWLDEFAKTEHDSAYLCFLRLLSEYRQAQAHILDDAIAREEGRGSTL